MLSPALQTARRASIVMLLMAAMLVALALPALAHVTVRTDNANADGFAVYTVRIPNERDDSGTTTVEVQIPEELAASRYHPIPGWDVEIADGVLTLSGSVIEPGQFLDVRFQGRNPAEPTTLRFAAIQTYESGEVVEWNGEEGSDSPASLVEIVAAETVEEYEAPATDDATEDATEDDAAAADDEGAELDAEPVASVTADEGTDPLAIAGLIAGVLGLMAGGAALARSGTKG